MYYFYTLSDNKFCAYTENSAMLNFILNIINPLTGDYLFEFNFEKTEISSITTLEVIFKIISNEVMILLEKRDNKKGIIYSCEIVYFNGFKLILNTRNEIDNLVFKLIKILDLIEFCLKKGEPLVIKKSDIMPEDILLKIK